MWRLLAHYWRMRLRRYRTWLKVTFSPSFRRHWAHVFATNPHLYWARCNFCFITMSGFYNDETPGGFMTTEDARKIYWTHGCQ